MVRTFSLVGIVRADGHKDVTTLRVQHAVEKLSIRHDSHAHSGAHSNIDGRIQPFGAAPGGFPQHGTVDIRVKSHRNVKSFAEIPADIKIFPWQFRRGGDVTVGF